MGDMDFKMAGTATGITSLQVCFNDNDNEKRLIRYKIYSYKQYAMN